MAQLEISGKSSYVAGVMMRHECSIAELGEIASGYYQSVVIAASVSEISDSSCRSDLRSIKASQRPPVLVTSSRTLLGAKQSWLARPSPARPQEVIGFEELLSELITKAWMLRPHLGSRLVKALLTFGVHCRTLSGEGRCGRMIANPVKSTCASVTPQIVPSKLAAGAVLRAKRLCLWRRETAFSPESMAGSSEARVD